MLCDDCYAKNYAGIIGTSLACNKRTETVSLYWIQVFCILSYGRKVLHNLHNQKYPHYCTYSSHKLRFMFLVDMESLQKHYRKYTYKADCCNRSKQKHLMHFYLQIHQIMINHT